MQNYLEFNRLGKESIINNIWLGTCATTVGVGLLTYNIPPSILYTILRAGVHFTGALAFPAGGAFVSSLAMHGIEKLANLGIDSYNKKHPEKTVKPFEINPKIKTAVKFISSAVVGIAYARGTLGYEADQYTKTGIFQTEQYVADIVGSLGGIAAFNQLDIKDTTALGLNHLWKLGKAIAKPLTKVENAILKPLNRVKNLVFGKNRNNSEKVSNIAVEEICVDSEIGKTKEEPHVWDLSLYKNSPESQKISSAHNPEIPDMTVQKLHTGAPQKNTSGPSSNELNADDEINI